MSNVAIKVESISKLYELGEFNTGSLSHDINRWWAKKRGKEDPFSKIDQHHQNKRIGNNFIWALKDIDFSLVKGEALGIIGKNGAGKSTLLKILSKVTAPTKGRIKLNGRIASLLEIGTGFHPEMTGRENIFLNGAILGMTNTEIKRKFDEIVAFSGVEKYIDTPVKRYSSGMYVRLAFAVAAHLESEILIVDEVLAVGDFEFQQKCLGKMNSMSKGEGRTVLFVSHNLSAIKQFCTKAILLEDGVLKTVGTVESCLQNYLANIEYDLQEKITNTLKYYYRDDVIIDMISVNGSESTYHRLGADAVLHIVISGYVANVAFFDIEIYFTDQYGKVLFFSSDGHSQGSVKQFNVGKFKIEKWVRFPALMNRCKLYMKMSLTNPNVVSYFDLERPVTLEFEGYVPKSGIVFNESDKGYFII